MLMYIEKYVYVAAVVYTKQFLSTFIIYEIFAI